MIIDDKFFPRDQTKMSKKGSNVKSSEAVEVVDNTWPELRQQQQRPEALVTQEPEFSPAGRVVKRVQWSENAPEYILPKRKRPSPVSDKDKHPDFISPPKKQRVYHP